MNNSTTIFKALSNQVAEWSAGTRKRFAEVANQRNDQHHFDEALLFVKGLLILTIAITLAFGVYFHYNIFKNAGGSTAIAVGASLLLFIVAEILKIVFSQYTLLAIFNGVAFKMPVTNLFLTLCFGTLATGAFLWSIHISTKAVSTVNLGMNTTQLYQEKPFTPPPSIALLDQQIADADAASAKAQKSTWRKRPTAEGLAVMQAAEKTKQALIAQRTSEWNAAKEAHDKMMEKESGLLSISASTLSMFGGYAEYTAIFLLLIITLLKIKCYDENIQQTNNAVATTPTPSPQSPQHNGFDFGEKVANAIDNYFQSKKPIIVSGFQNKNNNSASNHSPILENRGSAVATTPTPSPQPVAATPAHNSHTFIPEVVEDIEGKVLELCDRFKKEWPSRWRKRMEAGGDLSTMQANFTQYYNLLNTYLADNYKPLSEKAKGRVKEFCSAYENEILPTIKNTTP